MWLYLWWNVHHTYKNYNTTFGQISHDSFKQQDKDFLFWYFIFSGKMEANMNWMMHLISRGIWAIRSTSYANLWWTMKGLVVRWWKMVRLTQFIQYPNYKKGMTICHSFFSRSIYIGTLDRLTAMKKSSMLNVHKQKAFYHKGMTICYSFFLQ